MKRHLLHRRSLLKAPLFACLGSLALLAGLVQSPVRASSPGINLSEGLQGHWKFDEKTGLTASDASGKGHHGELFNYLGDDSQWVAGQVGGALSFDGLLHYVEVPDNASIGSGLTNSFTVAAWFKSNVPLSANGGTYRMLEKGDNIFLLQGDGNTNTLGLGGMNLVVKRSNMLYSASITQPLASNQWYHLAGTFDGTALKVYLDGQLKATRNVGGPIDDDALPLRIGSDDANRFFNGLMDDVRLWNRPLTDREVRNLIGLDLPEPPTVMSQLQNATVYANGTVTFSVSARGEWPLEYTWYKNDQAIAGATNASLTLGPLQAGDSGSYRVSVKNGRGDAQSNIATLTVIAINDARTGQLAWWKFDEKSGDMAADSTTNQNNGQLIDFMDPAATWVSGRVGGALQFDGQFSRVIVPDSPSLRLGGDASFALWLRPETYGTSFSAGNYDISEGRILWKGSQFDMFVVDNPGGVRQTILVNGASAPQTSLSLNEWQHFAVVFQGGTAQFYKNGFPAGGPVAGAMGAESEANLVIGHNAETLDVPRLFQGLMDEVGIWERPLSESEVLTLAGKDAAGAPVIDFQSGSATRLEDGAVDFMVQATGLRPVTYQWFHNGSPIAGATRNQLTLTNLTQSQAGAYTVAVSNAVGQATSTPMQLTVDVIRDVKSGLLAYWKFDETSGTRWSDSSGNGHHATMENGGAAPGVAGQIGGAYDLNGLDTFAVVPHKPGLVLADQASISVWVNPRGYGGGNGYGRILRKGINYDFLLLGSVQAPTFYGVNKTAFSAPNNSVDLESWQHIVFTYKNGVMRFYKNGQLLGNPINGRMATGTSDPLVIGSYQADLAIARVFDGLMDDLGLWNRALNPVEIEDIYKNGLEGKALDTVNTVLEPIRIQALAAVTGNKLQLRFSAPYTGRTYTLQQSPSIVAPTWSAVTGVQMESPSQGLMQATLDRPASGLVFLRVMVAP